MAGWGGGGLNPQNPPLDPLLPLFCFKALYCFSRSINRLACRGRYDAGDIYWESGVGVCRTSLHIFLPSSVAQMVTYPVADLGGGGAWRAHAPPNRIWMTKPLPACIHSRARVKYIGPEAPPPPTFRISDLKRLPLFVSWIRHLRPPPPPPPPQL